MIRAAVLAGFAELTRKLGGDPAGLLRQVGLRTRVLIEPDLPIEADKLCRLLEIAAIETGCDDFGLRLARYHDIGTLGPIGMLARDERSVGEAIRTLADYLHLHNSAAHLTLHAERDASEIAIALAARPGTPMRQASELMMAATVGVLRRFLGPAWNPERVCFRHSPAGRDLAHRRLFGCAVEFDEPVMAVWVPAADMRREVGSSNPEFRRYARRWIDALPGQGAFEEDFVEQARRLIPVLLSTGHCSAEHLAQYLRQDRRTVHRRLVGHGTSFSALVNGVRRELAQSLVSGSRRSLGEIADMLGFAHASGFTRWFAGEFGTAPSRWRMHRPEPGPSPRAPRASIPDRRRR